MRPRYATMLVVSLFSLAISSREVTLCDARMRPAADDVVVGNTPLERLRASSTARGVMAASSALRPSRENEFGIEFMGTGKDSMETGQNPAMTR